jgi:phosphopantetheinyl transferase
LKEAYLKAVGCGLTVRPSGVAFDLGPGGDAPRLRGPEAARWRFATRVRGGFVLAVAVETDAAATGAGLTVRLHPGGRLCRAAAHVHSHDASRSAA